MLSILHHGAVDGVTGSCHELQIDADNAILIDCGLFQGAETSPEGATAETLAIDFPIGHIRALVATHVHIDHVGRIPSPICWPPVSTALSCAVNPRQSCCLWSWKTPLKWVLPATRA
jgi:glyoxylase-like metal-dependent hydrolase (beta-lactamase superfamily II)